MSSDTTIQCQSSARVNNCLPEQDNTIKLVVIMVLSKCPRKCAAVYRDISTKTSNDNNTNSADNLATDCKNTPKFKLFKI